VFHGKAQSLHKDRKEKPPAFARGSKLKARGFLF